MVAVSYMPLAFEAGGFLLFLTDGYLVELNNQKQSNDLQNQTPLIT